MCTLVLAELSFVVICFYVDLSQRQAAIIIQKGGKLAIIADGKRPSAFSNVHVLHWYLLSTYY